MTGFRNAMMGAAGAAGGGFSVDNSAVFNIADTEYLVFSNGGTPSNTDIGTISFWFKRGLLGASRSNDQCVFGHGTGGSVKLQMNLGGGTGTNGDTIIVGNGHATRTSAKFRDPHAWYHIVIRVDTSQSTSSDRQRIYINGEVASLGSASYPSQNDDIFGTDPWEIAKYTGNTVNGYDGYIAEFCYCDGQSLAPTAFGETDDNGVWRPKDPSSNTFGNNGFYLPFNAGTGASLGSNSAPSRTFTPAAANYEYNSTYTTIGSGTIDNNGSPGVSGRLKNPFNGDFTFSFTATAIAGSIFGCFDADELGTFATGTDDGALDGMTKSWWYDDGGNGSGGGGSVGAGKVMYGNATQASSAIAAGSVVTITRTGSTIKITDDGSDLHSFSQTHAGPVYIMIGHRNITSKSLNFDSVSMTGSEAFAVVNSPTQTTDSPTSNFCTFTPLYSQSGTLSEGNREVVAANSTGSSVGLGSMATGTSGKYYVEFTFDNDNGFLKAGFLSASNTDREWPGGSPSNASYDLGGIDWQDSSGKFVRNGVDLYSGSTYTTGDVIGFYLDFDNDAIWASKNGTLENGASQAEVVAGTTTNAIATGTLATDGALVPHATCNGGTNVTVTINTGQSAFNTALYTGYTGLSAKNIAASNAPAIEDGSAYFQTTLYTGNGASSHEINQSGENSTFAPDLVWTKGLTVTEHRISDVIRGATKVFFTDTSLGNSVSTTETSSVLSFDSDGFTVGSGGGINGSGQAKLAWQWKAGDSNTSVSASGSGDDAICACTHRANQTAGFSLVKYTGRNSDISNGQHSLVTHGLGAKPDAVWIKSIDDTQNWVIMLADSNFGNDAFVSFNSTDDLNGSDFVGYFGGDSTSTHFVVGNDNKVNKNGDEYMAYVFKTIPGFSKFGLFEGNGNANGPFIELGFKPSWILVKSIDANSRPWVIHDSARNPFNVTDLNLIVNDTSASTSSNLWDFLSNGFKIRDSLAGDNENNKTHLYMAFAENPFAGTTPVTAR